MDDLSLRLYSKSETAKLLGIGKDKLGKLLNSGRLGFIQIENRMVIPYSEILSFINNNTVHLKDENKINSGGKNLSKKTTIPQTGQFDSITIFNQLLQENSNGKYLH